MSSAASRPISGRQERHCHASVKAWGEQADAMPCWDPSSGACSSLIVTTDITAVPRIKCDRVCMLPVAIAQADDHRNSCHCIRKRTVVSFCNIFFNSITVCSGNSCYVGYDYK